MIKPGSLRAAIGAAIPVLATNTDALRMWIDKGRIVARHAANRSFEYRYTLNIVITDWVGHPSVVFLAINDWLEINQPDLMAGGRDESYSFEADIIDSERIDLSIDLELAEAVTVVPRVGGGYTLEHRPEDNPLLPDMEGLSAPTIPLSQIWLGDSQLIPDPA